ncbi:class I SAM-dependent methyltransferase [Streptantibioticus rubrisoli]|uniref:Class I SAM-dependent methyltransferase n=1 Tax=Streptantibioticus rubrisoli TaxID=1387313 RepID=A0ABT1P912_9ACTN|nr:class I SAM-dependent methyltransferase [Streptantibioticus rubrisoli]MCQ4041845.1 class I SAM-dependent methyltransferase [Streptantibioticus rubrisoli]
MTDHRWHTPEAYDKATTRLQQRNASMVARLHPRPDTVRRAYELGCGTGALTEELLGVLPQARITALDVSAEMLRRARDRGLPQDRVEFRLGSFLDEGGADGHDRDAGSPAGAVEGRYDAVFSNAALHWLYPEYSRCFTRIRRLLAPGGVLCAAMAGRTAAADAFDRRIEEATRAVLPPGDRADFNRRRTTDAQVAELAGASGFSVEDVFLVERHHTMSAPAYATWWVASGGPWSTDRPEEHEAVATLTEALGGVGAEVELVHASTFMVLRA